MVRCISDGKELDLLESRFPVEFRQHKHCTMTSESPVRSLMSEKRLVTW